MSLFSSKLVCFLLLGGSAIAMPAQAGWFGKSTESEVTLDGTLTIEMPFQESFDINTNQIGLTGSYRAYKPDEKGVKTYIHKSSSNPTVWVPWVTTHKERLAVDRELQIKPEWVRLDAPNKMVIRLPERLPGPG